MSALRGSRLVPAAGLTWLVAGIGTVAPESMGVVAGAAAVAAVAGIVILRGLRVRGPAPMLAAVALVTVALACSSASALHLALAEPSRASARAELGGGGRAVTVEVWVTGKLEPRAAGAREFDALVRSTSSVHAVAVPATVRLESSDASAAVDVGAHLRVSGGARDAYPGDRAVVAITARTVEVLNPPAGLWAATAALRQSLVAAAAGLPGGGGELVPGLAVGDTSAVSGETDAQMKASSLSHLTAVSGANCALVVGIGYLLAAACGARRGARVAVGVVALAGFVALVTPEPSVVRAATMAGIAMIALLLGREGAGLAVLSAAVVTLLITDPWLAQSLGFALSVAATAALLVLARPLARALARLMPHPLALGLSVPLAAQLACGPLLILVEPRVALWGVAANVLAAPAAPAATVVGLLACLSAPVPILQSGLAALAWLPASWIAATASVTSSLPFASLSWPEGLGGAALLIGVSALVVFALVIPRESRWRRARGVSIVSLSAVVGVVLGGVALSGVAGRWTIPGDWTVLACDVGQGDALLVRESSHIALIDTGPDPALLGSCLDRVGIDRIDLLVLTHFDADHAGGVDAVLGRVGLVLHGPPADDGDSARLAALEGAGATLHRASAGVRGLIGAAEWSVLWPRQSSAFAPGNDSSVVIEFGGGDLPRSLFLGDLSAAPQAALRTAVRGPYDLVKVAHHGSADQDPGLYRVIDARVAVITVGADNPHGHPRDAALALLAGVPVGRTDQSGIVAILGAGTELRLWRERGGVPADG